MKIKLLAILLCLVLLAPTALSECVDGEGLDLAGVIPYVRAGERSDGEHTDKNEDGAKHNDKDNDNGSEGNEKDGHMPESLEYYIIEFKNTVSGAYTIKSGTKVVACGAFNGTSLTSITIPDSVTSIGSYAFSNCSRLKSVTFENKVGWWYASSSDASSGKTLSSTDLADTVTAATYLTNTYCTRYLFRT